MKVTLIILISLNIIQFGLTEDSINYIIDNIYLGDKEAAKDEELLKKYNITAVVNCANSFNSKYQDLRFIVLSMHDESSQNLFPKIEIGYKFIKANSKGKNNIFVHCQAGRSRSASMVIFYIMKEKGWDYEKCYKYVKERRSVIGPNSGFKRQLKEYYEKYIRKK